MFGKRITSTLLAGALAVLALALAGPAGARSSDDNGRSFHGTVASIAKNGQALTINRAGGQTRFVVRASTTYEHVSGLGGLSKGTAVEVHAFRNGDRWIATRIEANPGGDDRGGDDNGGSRGGSDDPPGDDHGSGGHGSDD
ncbi:MAG: DUF5666 domain-containing protein [Solirubrobacterales bacterium]